MKTRIQGERGGEQNLKILIFKRFHIYCVLKKIEEEVVNEKNLENWRCIERRGKKIWHIKEKYL